MLLPALSVYLFGHLPVFHLIFLRTLQVNIIIFILAHFKIYINPKQRVSSIDVSLERSENHELIIYTCFNDTGNIRSWFEFKQIIGKSSINEITVYYDVWGHAISLHICLQIKQEYNAKDSAVSMHTFWKEKVVKMVTNWCNVFHYAWNALGGAILLKMLNLGIWRSVFYNLNECFLYMIKAKLSIKSTF